MSLETTDPPGKTGTPEIIDWDVDKVKLKWTAPKNNGGAPVTGYVIEKKEKFGSNWEEILTTDVNYSMIIMIISINLCDQVS